MTYLSHISIPGRSFSTGPDTFATGPDTFSTGTDTFATGPDTFATGPDTFATGTDMLAMSIGPRRKWTATGPKTGKMRKVKNKLNKCHIGAFLRSQEKVKKMLHLERESDRKVQFGSRIRRKIQFSDPNRSKIIEF